VLDCVDSSQAKGVILHWFMGDGAAVDRAVELGCFFSVNAAMSDEALRRLPFDRVLPETDFPSSRARTGASAPGDIGRLEMRTSQLTKKPLPAIRLHWYQVLGRAIDEGGAWSRTPRLLRGLVESARG
jgi:TatD DNase family protein